MVAVVLLTRTVPMGQIDNIYQLALWDRLCLYLNI